MILTTARLSLRPLRAEDAPALFAILGDEETAAFWDRPALSRPATAAEVVSSQLAAMEDGEFLYWTACLKDDALKEDAVGSLDLSHLDFIHRRAEIGFFFRRDQWGQGYGREAAAALIGHAFGPLKLERLEARVHAGNTRAKRLLKQLGFQPEGRLTGHMRREGARYDVDVFGLLKKSSA